MPASARACSGPLCWVSEVVPSAPDLVVPANLPGFSSAGVWKPLTMWTEDDTPRLFRADGDDVGVALVVREVEGYGAFVIELPVLKPDVDYRLIYSEQCEHILWDMGEPTHELGFRTGPAVPLPRDLGMTTVASHGDRWLDVADDGGGCSESIWANVADLTATLDSVDPTWKALVVDTWVEADGTRLTYEPSILPLDHDWAEVAPALHAWVWTSCDLRTARDDYPLPYGADASLPPGRYDMRVGMRIAGSADALYGGTVQVDLRCEERRHPGETSCEEDVWDGPCGAERTDAGSGDHAASTDSCRCALPLSSRPPPWLAVFASCAACLWWRRRMRTAACGPRTDGRDRAVNAVTRPASR
jgi:hypothetical protein